MKNMTLEHIAAVCGGIYYGKQDQKTKEIEGAVIDSRLVQPGFLFIPVKGEKVDGHRFIPDVFEKGALAVLSEYRLEDPAGPYILVENTLEAMKQLAENYRKSLDIKVVGITGSVGKTSTKEMIAAVLAQRYRVLKTEGNYNNEIGLPLTIFKIRQEHEVAVLEMGISEFGEMHRLAKMANPDICVITNIGLCHLENLRSREGILKAKTESFEHLTADGVAVLNGDDDKLCEKKMVNGRPAVFYGLGELPRKIRTEEGEKTLAPKQIYAVGVESHGLAGTGADIHIRSGNEPEICFSVEIPIAGEHNVYNALAAAAVAKELGLTAEEIKQGIESVETIGGRSNLLHNGGMTIIDDCYNANPVSMKASLDVLAKAEGRKIAVLGDMGELGAEEIRLHASVGEHFKGKGIEELFCTGERTKALAEAAKQYSPKTAVHYFDTKEELEEALLSEVRKGDTILVKASHFMGFSHIVNALLSGTSAQVSG